MAGLVSLSSAALQTIGERRSALRLIDLNPDRNDAQMMDRIFVFQYWPDQIVDSKEVNYQNKEIPGGSISLLQWVASGQRTLSFTAVFTCDNDLLEIDGSESRRYGALRQIGEGDRNVDIRSAVAWLRRFLMPSYKGGSTANGSMLTIPPRKLLFHAPGTGIGMWGGDPGGNVAPDSVECVMTQCEVTLEDCFPSGLPRYTTVQLTLSQIAQKAGVVRFPAMTPLMERAAIGGPGSPFLGYQISRRYR